MVRGLPPPALSHGRTPTAVSADGPEHVAAQRDRDPEGGQAAGEMEPRPPERDDAGRATQRRTECHQRLERVRIATVEADASIGDGPDRVRLEGKVAARRHRPERLLERGDVV